MTFRIVSPCCGSGQPAMPPPAMNTLADFCRAVFCCSVDRLDEHAAEPGPAEQTGSKTEPSEDADLTPEQMQHISDKMNSSVFVSVDNVVDKKK